MSALLRTAFICGCCMALAAVGWTAWTLRNDPQRLIETRAAHVTQFLDSMDLFEMTPDQLRAAGFLLDTPRAQAEFEKQAWQRVPYLYDLPTDLHQQPTMVRAKAIAAAMSGGGSCDYFRQTTRLIDKLRIMPSGMGYCSDHTEGFLALAPMWDIFAVEVSTSVHTILSVWVPEENRWVLFDPQSCLIPRDSQGRYLSLPQTRDRYLADLPVDWEFFGTPEKHFTCVTPAQLGNFDSAEKMRDATMTLGINVLENDVYRETLGWMPKPVRQAALLATGIMPHYVMLQDEHTRMPAKLAVLWWRDVLYVSAMSLMLVLYPLARALPWAAAALSSVRIPHLRLSSRRSVLSKLHRLHTPRRLESAA